MGFLICFTQAKDFVMFPTKLEAVNSKIESALAQKLIGKQELGDTLQPIIRQHYQVQAISLEQYAHIKQQKIPIPDSVQGIVLGHPGGGLLTHASYKMSLSELIVCTN